MTKSIFSSVIVGSGLSAYAAILALNENNEVPLIIDPRITHPAKSEARRKKHSRIKSLASKNLDSSDFMYTYDSKFFKIRRPDTPLHLTMAWGGLSLVWGTGIQPINPSKEFQLPEQVLNDLNAAIKHVLKHIPSIGSSNATDTKFPWPKDQISNPVPIVSNRIKKLLSGENIIKLKNNEFFIGQPRLAIDFSESSSGCTFHGTCLTGCPNKSLFSTNYKLDTMISQRKIEYLQGLVLSIIPEKELIEVRYADAEGNEKSIFTKKIFLAAGPLATPMILQRSNLIPNEIDVKDSQVYYTASLSLNYPKIYKNFKLGQAIICSNQTSTGISETYMSIYENSNENFLRVFYMIPLYIRIFLPKSILRNLFKFLLPGIGFLPQKYSGKIKIRYDSNSRQHSIDLIENTRTNKTFQVSKKNLRKVLFYKKLFLIAPKKLSLQSIGAGFHSGASLPISDKGIVNFQGGIRKYPNVYICDASSIPKIVTGAHTLGVMGNSYRIAKKASDVQ